jgi:hypothetical protein
MIVADEGQCLGHAHSVFSRGKKREVHVAHNLFTCFHSENTSLGRVVLKKTIILYPNFESKKRVFM